MFINEIYQYQPFWGEWVIDCKIGEGSFGSVYRISRQDFTFVNKAAMKVICVPKDQLEYDKILKRSGSIEAAQKYCDEIRDQLLNEIKILNRFKGNSSIVSMEDYKVFGCSEGQFGFCIIIRMELCKTITEHISGRQDFFSNPTELIRLGATICDALTILHGNSVLHRDIKPSNIFVSQDGNYKLGDFGMAAGRYAGEDNPGVAGTYDYMAPEVYNGREYDARADIYSLGLTLYYFANGLRGPYLEKVFEAPTREDKNVALARRLNREQMLPPALTTQGLSAVILRACSYEPNERFVNASEFKAALLSFVASPAYQNNISGYQSGSVSGFQAYTGGSLSTGRSFSASGVAMPMTYSQQQAKPKKKRKLLISLIVASSVLLIVAVGVFVLMSVDSFNLFENNEKETIDQPDSSYDEIINSNNISEFSDNATINGELLEDNNEILDNEDSDLKDIHVDEVEELSAKKDPVLLGEMTVSSKNGRIMKGTSFSDLIITGDFFDGNDLVSGELIIDDTGLISQSGEYKWKFLPYLNELYNEIEGSVRIKAFEPNMIEGMTQYESIEDKSEILYLSLEGEGLTDTSFLSEAINIEKLNLDDNNFTNLNGLEKCTHLQSLAFNNNTELTDISSLWQLKELKKVYMDSTGLDASEINRLNEMLRVNSLE